jgi:hypothetical protein
LLIDDILFEEEKLARKFKFFREIENYELNPDSDENVAIYNNLLRILERGVEVLI